MPNNIVRHTAQRLSTSEVMADADMIVRSGLFPEVQDAARAYVIIRMGEYYGLSPAQSLAHLHFIPTQKGFSIEMSATLMRASIRSMNYDYRFIKKDHKGCVMQPLRILPDGTRQPMETNPDIFPRFLEEDAKRANLLSKHNWKAHPEDMYVARATSRMAKQYMPEIFAGPAGLGQGEVSHEPWDDAEDTTHMTSSDVSPMTYLDMSSEELEERRKLLDDLTLVDTTLENYNLTPTHIDPWWDNDTLEAVLTDTQTLLRDLEEGTNVRGDILCLYLQRQVDPYAEELTMEDRKELLDVLNDALPEGYDKRDRLRIPETLFGERDLSNLNKSHAAILLTWLTSEDSSQSVIELLGDNND